MLPGKFLETWKVFVNRPSENIPGHVERKLSIKPGNFLDHLETFIAIYLLTFHAIWKLSRPSGSCPGNLKLVRQSGNCPGPLETFQAIWKLSRPSGKFPGHLENFQAICKHSRPSVNSRFPDCLFRPSVIAVCEFFQYIRKFSRPTENYYWETFNHLVKDFTAIKCFIAITYKSLCKRLIYA